MRLKLVPVLLGLVLLLSLKVSIVLGRYWIDPILVYKSIMNPNPHIPDVVKVIVVNYRLPRILTAIMTGAILSCSGVVLQSILRNPLVDPYILGISSGAAFGAALSLTLLPLVPIEFMAFTFSILAFMLTISIAGIGGYERTISIVLAGVAVTALFSAALAIFKYMIPDPNVLATIIFWTMGSFAHTNWVRVFKLIITAIATITLLTLMSWRINVLTLSDEEARALGVNVKYERLLVICIASAATSITVSVVGVIGWIGLIIPNLVRLLVGPDNRLLIPSSAILGGVVALIADDIARCLLPEELPITAMTTIIGVPYLLYLMRRGGKVYG